MNTLAEADFNQSKTGLIVRVTQRRGPGKNEKQEPIWTAIDLKLSESCLPAIEAYRFPPQRGGNVREFQDDSGRTDKSDRVYRRELIRSRLEQLVIARVRDLNRLIDSTVALREPELITEVAVDEFRRTRDVAYLERAATLMDNFGAAAWKALCDLSLSHPSVIAPFICVIANCDGVPQDQRAAELETLAVYCEPDALERIVEAVSVFSEEKRRKILLAVSRREPECGAVTDAREALESLMT